jgi:cell division protein ZapA
LRVAVLAALNIADELMQAGTRMEQLTGVEQTHRSRAHSLAGLLDEVIEEKRRAG